MGHKQGLPIYQLLGTIEFVTWPVYFAFTGPGYITYSGLLVFRPILVFVFYFMVGGIIGLLMDMYEAESRTFEE